MVAYFTAMLAVTASVAWVLLVLNWVRRDQGPSRTKALGGVGVVLVLAWSWRVLPQAISTVMDGRPAGRGDPPLNALAHTTNVLLGAAIVAVSILMIGPHRGSRMLQHPRLLLMMIAPWVFIQLSTLYNGDSLSPFSVVLPLSIAAVWLAAPSMRELVVIARLTAGLAAISLAMAVAVPDLAFNVVSGTSGKTWLSSRVLAGPMSHPNILGITLAMGLPFLVAAPQHRLRRWGTAITLIAIVLSGSRGSLVVAFVVLVSHHLGRLLRRPQDRRRFLGAVLIVGVAGAVYLPLSTTDAAAYTNRGAIWAYVYDGWIEQPWLGRGAEFFSNAPEALATTHAHSSVLHLAVLGGIACLVATFLFGVTVWRRCRTAPSASAWTATLLLVALTYGSWFETPVTFTEASDLPRLIPLAVLVLGRRAGERGEFDGIPIQGRPIGSRSSTGSVEHQL